MGDKNMIADRYMVVTSLGTGGMADVFLAIDTILNREVAVKVLRGDSGKDPVTLLRFQREASAVSKMHHPNIVEVYDTGEFAGENYIVMEYVRGKTLKQLIRQRGALEKEEAVGIMKQLVLAVTHAHENNIIHRDIKPQNVLVKDDGTVKITDFGIALAHDAVQLTQTDSVLGSAHYIAPETTRGENATVQIDVYALGVVFYELLTGSVPFTGDNPVQIAMKHMREEIPSVKEFNPTIPQSIDNIVIRATAKNRIYRYASANDMSFDLDMCLMKEFANVEKVKFSEEDTSDGTVVFSQPIKGAGVIEKNSTGENQRKKKRNMRIAALVTVFALFLSGGVLALYYSNTIDGFGPKQYVDVPNVLGLSEEEAKVVLEEKGFILNKDIKREVTDNVEEGKISAQSPKKGAKSEKGSEIRISVSTGMYYVVENFVGRNLADIKETLEAKKIDVITVNKATSEFEAGHIIEQFILEPGDKVKPGEAKKIKFTVAVNYSFIMQDYEGTKIDIAKSSLEAMGAKVSLVQETPNTENKTEEEIAAIERGVVIRQSPQVGSYYTQSGNNVITLYYY